MLGRLLTLIRKELQLTFRDPQSRRLLILPVILQVALFPFAATLEVKNSTLVILNQDQGAESREIVQRLAIARAFPTLLLVHSQQDVTRAIDEQRALVGLEFSANFSRALAAGRSAQILAVIDGRRSNSAQIAAGYVQSIIQDYANEHIATGIPSGAGLVMVRNWFNPNLEYRWFVLPVLVGVITMLGSLVLTALSVAREREQGTLDQLLVSPLTPGLIMIGKTVPAILIACGQATIIAIAAVFLYRIPLQGSIFLLYFSMLFFALSLAGFGLFISALCNTQQQAFLGVFTFMVPSIMLSGFVSPVENMPLFFRGVAWINPVSHFIVITKGIFLKGYDWPLIWPNLWPLLVIATFTMSMGYWMFRRRIA